MADSLWNASANLSAGVYKNLGGYNSFVPAAGGALMKPPLPSQKKEEPPKPPDLKPPLPSTASSSSATGGDPNMMAKLLAAMSGGGGGGSLPTQTIKAQYSEGDDKRLAPSMMSALGNESPAPQPIEALVAGRQGIGNRLYPQYNRSIAEFMQGGGY